MKWEDHNGILVAFVQKSREDLRGRSFRAQEALRIIRERGSDVYRLDFAGAVAGSWLPWEAVTDESFQTVAAAKNAAIDYVKGRIGKFGERGKSRFGS